MDRTPSEADHLDHNQLFIGGEWVCPQSADRIGVSSASSETRLGSAPCSAPADVDAAVKAARQAFDTSGWPQSSPESRADALLRLADQIDARAPEMARLVSMQNGMPITTAMITEARMPQVLLRYFAEQTQVQPGPERHPHLLGGESIVRHEPMGVRG